MKISLALRLFGLVTLVAASAGAAGADWDTVRKIPLGASIEAAREDGKTFRGSLERVTENQLVVTTSEGPVSMGRSTIRKVGIKNASRRGRNAAIGAAAAGGAVALAMVLGCPSCFGETDGYGGKVAAGMAAGAGAGALIGWLMPAYRTVYKAPKRKKRP